jgi:hypothetical protein
LPYNRSTDPQSPIGFQLQERKARRINLNERGWFLSIRNGLLGPFASIHVTREASQKVKVRLTGVDAQLGDAAILVLAFEYGIRPPNDPSSPRSPPRFDDDRVSAAAG